MDINIKGDPGTGNTYSETKIGYVENYNPNATGVVTNHFHYGDEKRKSNTPEQQGEDEQRKMDIRRDIMTYVGKLKPYASDAWKNRYERTWEAILSAPAVAKGLYNVGRQKDTTFNRNLVANIISLLKHANVLNETRDNVLTQALEGNKEHAVRAQLNCHPSDPEVSETVQKVLQA